MLDHPFMTRILTEKTPKKVLRGEDEAGSHNAVASVNTAAQNAEATEATRKVHELSTKPAVKLYAKGIIFSLTFSLAAIMEGYDTSLIGTFFGFQPFLDKFEDQYDPESAGRRIVSARWQSLLSIGSQVNNPIGSLRLSSLTSAAQVGNIIGLCINGWTSEKFGFRKTMFGSLFYMIAFTCIPFLAQHLRDHLIGATLQG